jgi:serine phosphatase RsbU (regulator of sigma subunit)/anti-sigma regulatory factor (Ser/Thr protein kinase)
MSTSTTQPSAQVDYIPESSEYILLVDDDAYVLESLRMTLFREGHAVLATTSTEEALKFLHQYPIAVVICDQLLPGMSGSELLKETERIIPDAVRIALTGNSDLSIALEAINIGHVSYFIMKPWDNTTLNQVVLNSLERYRLIRENRSLQNTIIQQHKELEKTHATLRYELQLGARIHEELLLGKLPENLRAIDLAAATIPSKDIDGDFFDFFQPTGDLFDVAVGDVMGKGIPAALVGIALKIELQRFAMPFTKSVFCEQGQPWELDLLSPSKIVGYTDEALTPQLMRLDFFVTLLYGRFDFGRHTFTFVDCGTPKPIHYSKVTKQCQLLSGVNFPIGVQPGQKYQQIEISWNPGDIFVIYSDGVTEARSSSGEQFGVERLCDIVRSSVDSSAANLLKKIKEAVTEFSGKNSFDDDLTLVVARMQKANSEKVPIAFEEVFTSDLDELPAVRDFVARICENSPGNTHKLSKDLQLAINEAFCNIIEHAYQRNKYGEVIIRGTKLSHGVLFDLCDKGVEFDPLLTPRPVIPATKECGYGLFIMGQIADKLIYMPKKNRSGWNRLRIYKSYEQAIALT